jgi:hypothetical protein
MLTGVSETPISQRTTHDRANGCGLMRQRPPLLTFCTRPATALPVSVLDLKGGTSRACNSSSCGKRGHSRRSRSMIRFTSPHHTRPPHRVNCSNGLVQEAYVLGSGSHYPAGPITLPRMPERVETPIFTMTMRRNAFTVLGLIFIRRAISLLVSP